LNAGEFKNIPALSIRQPWAWFITRPDLTDPVVRRRECKNVENRDWQTSFRGRVLIHASKTFTEKAFDEAMIFAGLRMPGVREPRRDELLFGGIVGSARIISCAVGMGDCPWFTGPYGFVIEEIEPLPLIPCRGMQGFFMPKLP
jgi:hypothetical protein